MKIATQDDIRYAEQTEALNGIAAKLGVVAYRPGYHGSSGDRNTVLFYLPEDEAHNRMVDRQPVHYGRSEAAALRRNGDPGIPDGYVYRDSLWTFENSDANGKLDMDFANRGTIDLRRADWKERVEGRIRLALLKKRQYGYVRSIGGWHALIESDSTNNGLNREIIAAMKQIHGLLYLGSVNYYSGQSERIRTGEESVYEEYAGQEIYDFHCDFAVPVRDEVLEEMIRAWNRGTGPHPAELVDRIMARINELGGEHFVWS